MRKGWGRLVISRAWIVRTYRWCGSWYIENGPARLIISFWPFKVYIPRFGSGCPELRDKKAASV